MSSEWEYPNATTGPLLPSRPARRSPTIPELVQGLNYEIDCLTDQSYVLKDTSDGHERAVAVFLQEDESFDHAQARFVGQSPVAYALNEADKRNLNYVIGNSGDTLRLYTTDPDAGFGSRGRTDTYVEVNTSLLADEKAAYLWLLFSANALRDDGALHDRRNEIVSGGHVTNGHCR